MLFNEKKKKLSPRQFDEAVKALEEKVKAEVSPFEHDTPKKQQERVRRAREDQDFFNRTYLPHYFKQESPAFHRDMEELTETGEMLQKPVAIAAPRNHAKSTRTTFARPLKKALYGEKKFIVIIGNDESLARGMTVSIRVELEHNPRIIHDFGKQKSDPWSAGNFVTKGGTRVWARGIEQRIRGEKHGSFRPDMIIIDDPEDDEMVRNPERIKNLVNWVLEAVYPSLEPESLMLYWVGTLLSKKSALATVMKNPEWISKVYRAVERPEWDEEKKEFVGGTPLWPARFDLKKLSSIRNVIGSLAFNKEYQNEPKDDDAMFKEEWFQRFKWDALPNVSLYHYAGRDPSLKNGQANDYKAHVTVARGGAKIYVRYASIKRISIDQMVKEDFILVRRFGVLQLGLETVSWQDLLRREYNREAEVQKFYLPIVPIPRTGKDAVAKEDEMRIGGLSPLVEGGILQFAAGPAAEIGDMEELIEQLMYFPSPSVHDDGPDGLEIAVHLAEKRIMNKPSYEQVAQREARFGAGAW